MERRLAVVAWYVTGGRAAARAALALLALVAVAAARPARAHEVLYQVERGRAVAMKVFESDGDLLAFARYEVFSPADPDTPHQQGKTDRNGWLAFVPDAPGKWRVKVFDDAGHGLDVEVDAAPGPAAAATATGAAAPTSTTALVLRPLVGLAAIAAVFGLLLTLYRRKGTTR